MTRLPDDSALERLLQAAAGEPEAGAPDVDLGKYRLVTEIGRGGMAVVWEAWDTQLQRRVALKLLTPRAGWNRVLRGRFVREAQAAASLRHPNIAAVYDATPDYIAMQLVEGVTLDKLSGGDQRLLATLLRSAAEAVHSAHQAGVIHRDLKPSNMMVEAADSASPRLFVMDFGLAKQAAID